MSLSLADLGRKFYNTKDICNKFTDRAYAGPYERHFGHLKNAEFSLLEIGIYKGWSARVWREFFPKARIFAIDINPKCLPLLPEGVTGYIGSQSEPVFLNRVLDETGPLDIVVDDGGHKMDQQKISFETIFPRLKSGSTYVVEDLDTSYIPRFGGGPLGKPGTMIATLKSMVDEVNKKIHGQKIAPAEISEMHFYPYITFVVKK